MPRERTKSDAYTVRFAAELEPLIEQAAAAVDQTPRQWLEATFERALRQKFKLS